MYENLTVGILCHKPLKIEFPLMLLCCETVIDICTHYCVSPFCSPCHFVCLSLLSQSMEEGTWVILDRPPAGDAIDLDKFERQKVVVDFRLADSLTDNAQRYVLRKDRSGSYQMIDAMSFDDEKERDFTLSMVDENSKAAMVSVSLNVEAPSSQASGHVHGDRRAQPVFDSKRMPVVKLG